jgi:hypothetical protein
MGTEKMAVTLNLRAAAFVFCAMLGLAAPAFADLKAYNAAVLRGDFPTAASEAASTWPTLEKTRPDIFVIAREFGWTGMLAKKPDITRTIVSSLSEMKVADPSPEVTAVLLAWANFSIEPNNGTRKALTEALTARVSKPQADLISIRAAQELFRNEWARDSLDSAAKIAAIGEKLVGEWGEEMIDVRYAMRRNGLVSKFVQRPDGADFTDITTLVREIDQRLRREADPKVRDRLIGELATTIAWRGVEHDVLQARGRTPRSPAAEQEGEERVPADEWFSAPGEPSLPLCKLSLDTAGVRPKYPKQALTKRLPGYAIYAFEPGEGGAFKSARVLGSAPHDMFAETIEEILPAWKWKMNDKNPADSCRMPTAHIVHFQFDLAR